MENIKEKSNEELLSDLFEAYDIANGPSYEPLWEEGCRNLQEFYNEILSRMVKSS